MRGEARGEGRGEARGEERGGERGKVQLGNFDGWGRLRRHSYEVEGTVMLCCVKRGV